MWSGDADEVEFASVEEFPLELLTWFQTDGDGQGHGKVDVKTGVLSARADGLHTNWKGSRHFFEIKPSLIVAIHRASL